MQRLDQGQIAEVIPHRPPFLLVDEVMVGNRTEGLWTPDPDLIELASPFDFGEYGVEGRIFSTDADNPVYEGHFPDMPITPGVLSLDAIARAAGEGASRIWANHTFAKVGTVNWAKAIPPGATGEIRTNMNEDDDIVGGQILLDSSTGKPAVSAGDFRLRPAQDGEIRPHYLLEFGAQVGAVAALLLPELAERVPVFTGASGITSHRPAEGDVQLKAQLADLNVDRNRGSASLLVSQDDELVFSARKIEFAAMPKRFLTTA